MISDMAATREKNTEYTENKTLITLTDEIQNREGNIYEYAYGESSSYEEISEKSSLFSNLKDYVYGYVPFVNKKPSSTDNNQKNLNTVSRKSLGSRDHLKFFRIFSRTDPENDREQSYLEPKKYYPEENCPVELKSLGETQVS
ncbi:hypothetical protein Zmor_011338 [Zophobas morio]|uniref:Uncharacterized protein n=1 Tax=Zophobas morio TaxID=2755281 RepID=A0AA38MKB3_9CUCU|nr:hypothetical protein Zmor_011338 [Zophobas morio]